ncbi:kinesin-like protein KIF14 [Periplaneta americana]|uniref:kinesin-like protein KIF14 n=1 Tax=Periplaneta americana TaxID=6978 RepID=UPI0037E8022C
MKRATPLFQRIDDADVNYICGAPSSGRSSMPEKNSVRETDSTNQNVSDLSIPFYSSSEKLKCQSRTPNSRGGPLIRSRSIPSIKGSNEDKGGNKFTLPKPGDRTPVTHFCTPRRSGSGHPDEYIKSKQHGKQASDQTMRTPLKRFNSEVNLHKPLATPDCFSKVHMETPRNKVESEGVPGLLGEETSNLTVGIRVRPLSLKEQNDAAVVNVVSVEGSEIRVLCESGTTHTFTYDHCFWSCDQNHPQFASQEMVFTAMVQPLIDKAFEGYNACLFAYGQTGSGKSYSMMGMDVDTGSTLGKEVGIIPRFCHELFERIASLEDSNVGSGNSTCSSANVEISYFEIYNEKIHDLLGGSSDGGRRAPLKVREHPVFGPYVVDLSVHGVTSYEDLQGWLTVGNSQRATAATGMNEKSSRSHSIFSIILTQTQEEIVDDEVHKQCRRSKINLVDLAGSERLSHTCTSADRLREGVSINRSLLTLGKVIAALADNGNSKKKAFVPYRDSILTWLLRESLGGNSRTTMLATISPANIHLDETLATLRYACQARTIVNRVRINEDPHDRLIRELRAEVDRLRALREDYERRLKIGAPRRLLQQEKFDLQDKDQEIENLREQLKHSDEQLRQCEEQLTQAQKSWIERLEDSGRVKSAELNHLRHCGVAVQFDGTQQSPCLVNLAADPSLSGTLLYLLPPGVVSIGRLRATMSESGQGPDIALSGPLVQPHHCTIENKDTILRLIQECDAETFVNGERLQHDIVLHHGDRLVIGGNHYFRVCNPYDSSELSPEQPIDYEFAHEEIVRVQEEKLRAELEEAKRKIFLELEARKEVDRQLSFQKMNYEEKLEQHKNALAEMQGEKDELEIQKIKLEAEVKKYREEYNSDIIVTPYKSTLLQELEAVLNESGTMNDSIGKFETSQLLDNSDCRGLHELTVAVREANQRCKELDINFEFKQQHVFDKSSNGPTVRVRDLSKHMIAYWTPSSFLQWLHQLRDYEPNDSLKELSNIDVSWEDEDAVLGSSPDGSSVMDNTSTADSTLDTEDINNCLQQMETATHRLDKLCKSWRGYDKVNTIVESLHHLIKDLRSTFDSDHETSQLLKDSSQDSQLLGDLSPDKYFHHPLSDCAIPSRSILQSPCRNASSRTQKAVRFFLTTSQQCQYPD